LVAVLGIQPETHKIGTIEYNALYKKYMQFCFD